MLHRLANEHPIRYFLATPTMLEPQQPFSRKENHVSTRLLQAVNLCFARIYHQLTIRTPCQLPKHGAAILVCNHLSGLDPILIQAACPRLIRWMMAKEYYEQRGLKWVFEAIGAIPVDRGSRETSSTRAAFKALDDGYVLGIFPEGKIETSHELLPFQDGIALLAGKTGAPVFPAYLDGTQRGMPMVHAVLRRNRACVTFGEPMRLSRKQTSRDKIHEATAQVQAAVERLRQREMLLRHNGLGVSGYSATTQRSKDVSC